MSQWEDVMPEPGTDVGFSAGFGYDTDDSAPLLSPGTPILGTSAGQQVGQDDDEFEPQDPQPTWAPDVADYQGTYPAQDEDEATPFGGIEAVDGLVYSPEAVSPELQWQDQQVNVPLPPVRERPTLTRPTHAEPWKPGPDPTPPAPASSSSLGRLLAMTVIPLALMVGLVMLVLRIMDAYGL